MSFKTDFPIFANNLWLVYLDNTATTQKPQRVIDAISHFFAHDNANIHRGAYDLSDRSERLYEASKEKVRDLIGAESASEINYTYNSTYALNLLSLSLAHSQWLSKGDRVLLSAAEHHANIVPWLILKQTIGIEVDFFGITADFGIDFADFEAKFTPQTKVVSCTYVSNVTGAIFDLETLGKRIASKREKDSKFPLFVVDASQSVPNFRTDVKALQADFCFFTAHKVMADTGLGVLYGRRELLKTLCPALGGGGAINWVHEDSFANSGLPYRFEPGTPHIAWAVSLLAAIEYLDSIGGYETIMHAKKDLVEYSLERFAKLGDRITLLGPKTSENRIGVFSFDIDWVHPGDAAETFADANIAVRAGFHCAEPLAARLENEGSLRMSVYFYNDRNDLDRFFDVLESLLDQ